ncbi:hypothetical protein HME9302_00559 [Alteripontixanthobacter maritimus]|uniref:Uncharacterized protein n=2 Tax=Alteripontixanthobacter maritimus TaxID=2161824 RepID=A0A369Q4F3_9SPHN|nr:hypothetical protein HME9302_00559 [Alteripontixanthobacter maritimus]
MNVTAAYRLKLRNNGRTPLTGVKVLADLTTAHQKVPIAEQVADDSLALPERHVDQTIAAGETLELAGEIRLPIGEVRPIKQGGGAVFVPLLRLRIEIANGSADAAKAVAPIISTHVIGSRPAQRGGRMQPFRLDGVPQPHSSLMQRPIDAPPVAG